MLFSADFKHSRNSLIDLDADIMLITYAVMLITYVVIK